MKKIILIIGVLIISLIALFNIELKKDNKIIFLSFTDILEKYDEVTCYDEGVSYDKKEDISITNIDITKILFFYKVTLEYEKGNLCDYEYVLEEEYIKDFLANATIKENNSNIDLEKLIKNKTPIVSNKRYIGNDYDKSISYILNNKENILYIFYVDDLLVIQVGLSDEGPKFIAYK